MKKYLWIIVLLVSGFSYANNSSQNLSAQNGNETNVVIQLVDSKLANFDDKFSRIEQNTNANISDLKADTNEKLADKFKELDDKTSSSNTWLSIIGIVLTFFGIFVPIFGYILNRTINKNLKDSAEDLEKLRRDTKQNIDDTLAYADKIIKLIEEKHDLAKNLTQDMQNLRKSPPDEINDENKEDIQQIDQALKDLPENELTAEDWFIKGLNAQNNDKLFEAITYYNNCISIAPKPSAYTNRGNTYAQLQKYDEAVKDYKQAVELDHQYYLAYSNLALVYITKNDLKNALKYLEEAFKNGFKTSKEKININWKNYLENKDFKSLIARYKDKITD